MKVEIRRAFALGLLLLPLLVGCPHSPVPNGEQAASSGGAPSVGGTPSTGGTPLAGGTPSTSGTSAQPATNEATSAQGLKEWSRGIHRLGQGWHPATSAVVVVHQMPLLFTRQLAMGADGNHSIDGLIERLSKILEEGGSNLSNVVRINAYGSPADEVATFVNRLPELLPPGSAPVVTAVETPLSEASEKLAIDVVAAVDGEGSEGVRKSASAGGGPLAPADYSVAPSERLVFLSGRPEKGEIAEAAQASLKWQLALASELDCQPQDVAQIRVFLAKMEDAPVVLEAIRAAFAGQPVPPVSFVNWIASAPVEIEMIACRSATAKDKAEVAGSLQLYNPPGVKPSPNFSRAAVLASSTVIFTAGFVARKDGDGAAQTRDAFNQLVEALGDVGSDLRHGAKAHYFVSDDDAAKAIDVLRREYLDPSRPPAASKAKVAGVGRAGRSVVIDCIAVPAAR